MKIGAISRVSGLRHSFEEHPLTSVKTPCIVLTLGNRITNGEAYLAKLNGRLKSMRVESTVQTFTQGNTSTTHLRAMDEGERIQVSLPFEKPGVTGQDVHVFSNKFITLNTAQQEALVTKLKAALGVSS